VPRTGGTEGVGRVTGKLGVGRVTGRRGEGSDAGRVAEGRATGSDGEGSGISSGSSGCTRLAARLVTAVKIRSEPASPNAETRATQRWPVHR